MATPPSHTTNLKVGQRISLGYRIEPRLQLERIVRALGPGKLLMHLSPELEVVREHLEFSPGSELLSMRIVRADRTVLGVAEGDFFRFED